MTEIRSKWMSLGIDVGSSKSKLFALCLYDPLGQKVYFEIARPISRSFPPNNPGEFEDINQPFPWLSSDTLNGVLEALEGSKIIGKFIDSNTAFKRVAIDAPSGFACEGERIRETEKLTIKGFPTPDVHVFFSQFGPPHPHPSFLQSKVYWKQVGFCSYFWLIEKLNLQSNTDRRQYSDIAAIVCQGIYKSDLGIISYDVNSPKAALRESFPSHTYHVLHQNPNSDTMGVIDFLASLEWNYLNISIPTMKKMKNIQTSIDSRHDSPITFQEQFRKRKDRAGDLLDAFVSGALGIMEEFGLSRPLINNVERAKYEGVITVPYGGTKG